MNQDFINDRVKTIYVLPQLAGIRVDYSLGEEAPLFTPPRDGKLLYGVGYDSAERRKACGMPYHEKTCRSHRRWVDMLNRCYRSGASAYIGCTVCPKWHDFQEFADWFVNQPYALEEDMELDKDVLDPLNKVYSPEFCSLVPRVINQIFRDTRSQRGKLPIGVTVASREEGFISRLSMYGKSVYLGKCHSIVEAFEVYKAAHRKYCNELADRYERSIDARVVERLRSYTRHIHD